MDEQDNLSTEQAIDLARSNPDAFIKKFAEHNGDSMRGFISEFSYRADSYDSLVKCRPLMVYSEGGTEGAGEHTEKIFAILSPVGEALSYVKYEGFYSSYESTEWAESGRRVEPREVTVTQYFEI